MIAGVKAAAVGLVVDDEDEAADDQRNAWKDRRRPCLTVVSVSVSAGRSRPHPNPGRRI